MRNKFPLLKMLKTDHWVKPFLRHYKRTLVLAITLDFNLRVCRRADVYLGVFDF